MSTPGTWALFTAAVMAGLAAYTLATGDVEWGSFFVFLCVINIGFFMQDSR